MNNWVLLPELQQLQADFGQLDTVFSLQGERITKDPISDLIKLERQGVVYYVKRYYTAGRGIRAFRLRPRIQAEWENLQRFQQWGIRSEKVFDYGMQRRFGAFIRGAIVTHEIQNSSDLAELANRQNSLLKNMIWLQTVSQQIAEFTRILHSHNFAHNDLKWRNILVDDEAKVYFVDCPTGRFWWGPLLQYRIIKDLACLDKVAKKHLSRTQRLRFYLMYKQRSQLSKKDKKQLRKILKFFKGRE